MSSIAESPGPGALLRRLGARVVQATKLAIVLRLQALRRMLPRERRRQRLLRADRSRAEAFAASFAQASPERFDGTVLIDGTFDNANYWFRMTLLRRALGIAHADEIGITGPYAVADARSTFARLGIAHVVDLDSNADATDRAEARRLTEQLIANTREAADILSWRLPFDFPAMMLYDDVLKCQRQAVVDLTDPLLFDRVFEMLIRVYAAERLIESTQPRLVLLSHVGPLSWVAARRGIPSIVLFGQFGMLRFFKILRPEDNFDPYDHPTGAELDALSDVQADALAAVGREYIGGRLSGKTSDVGSRHAYRAGASRLDREAMARHFGWDPERRIVVIYASNWFDYPHFLGMERFRDFLDWIEATLAVACEVRETNWLFKPHPVDAHYGGVTLKDLVSDDMAANVRLVPSDWSSADVMHHADAAITYHGTAGVEYAVLGKPVLVPDAGWYHDCGFVCWPHSREDYLEKLTRPWWESLDAAHCARRAQVFAGWFFTSPSWQGGFVLNDDFDQWANYESIPALIENNPEAVALELATLKDWFHSDARFYNVYKMARAESYGISNFNR